MKSLLIVIKEEYLAKGIAVALMNYFQSIHTTKNPYEAISLLKNEKIDTIISTINFDTIDTEKYIEQILQYSSKVNSITLIKDAPLKLAEYKNHPNICIQKKPFSIKNIIDNISSMKENFTNIKKGEN